MLAAFLIFVVALVIFLATPHVTPNRSLSRQLGDRTVEFRRLRMVHGGGRS
jgi:hypothetical protein